jgi:hypothetical protein
LAQLVRASNGGDPLGSESLTECERSYLSALAENPAFGFTVKVQRSWCTGRAAKAAYLTLSILPAEMRDSLLTEWVDSGGGTQSFTGAESEAFLEFIAGHLQEPSHELTICRMELAALKAEEGVQRFERPALVRIHNSNCRLRRGRYSSVVHFYGEPQQILNALFRGEPCPPVSTEITSVIFGPGFDRLYKTASAGETALYERLGSPASTLQLLKGGVRQETIYKLLEAGVVEYTD